MTRDSPELHSSRRSPAFAYRGGEHRRRSPFGGRLRRLIPAVPLGLAAVILAPSTPDDLPPPIQVKVEGTVHLVAPGTSLGEARDLLDLRPRSGDLLDVKGVALVPEKYPGHLEVNDRKAQDSHVLEDADRVAVVDAEDRTEPLRVTVIPVPSGQVTNPQTVLGTTPGEQVITRGRLSDKLVSTVFRPTGPTDSPPAVALTFDDGPSSQYTMRIVRILKRFDVRATFFVIGYLAERYPDIVRKVAQAGMAVGNHSMNHPYERPFADLPPKQVRAQIEDCNRVLKGLGVQPVAFRPPGGSWDEDVLQTAEKLGLRSVLWSIDTRDFQGPKVKVLVRTVVRQARPGSIILMHDGGGDRSATIRALPKIIKRLRARGLGFETL